MEHDTEKTRYAVEHEWWFFFVPTWSFIVLCTTGDEYDYVCDMVGRDNELSADDALRHMVAQMVDFQDDGFRNYCDGLGIEQPLGDDYAKLGAEDIVSYYGAFVQSWGVPDFFDTLKLFNKGQLGKVIMMDIYTIANNATEVVRKYMRERAIGLNARNCNIDYGHTVFDDFKSIDVYVYPYGENSLRAFIVLSDSCGDVLDIHSDIMVVDNICPAAVAVTGRWACGFVDEWFTDMWNSARGIIEERERVERLAEIRDDVEFRAVVGD